MLVNLDLLPTHFLNGIFQLFKCTRFISLLLQTKDNVNTSEHFFKYLEVVRERKVPCDISRLGFLRLEKMTKSFVSWQVGNTKQEEITVLFNHDLYFKL